MSRAVQYRKFGGPGILQMAEVADPAPSGGEVRVAVKAVGLNPVDAKIFGGDIRLKILESIQRLTHPVCWFGSPRFPRGVARDFAGCVDAVGPYVQGFEIGQPVLGTLRSAPGFGNTKGALADKLIASVEDVVNKPESISFEVAASLGVAAQTVGGAFRQLDLNNGDVIVISAASGGMGSLASQIAVHRGATVIGVAGKRNTDYLRSLGAIPVSYGEDLKSRILAMTPRAVTKFLDCYGGGYVKLGFALGLPGHAIGTLIPSPGAIIRGAQFTGSRHAQPGNLPEITGLVADGAAKVALAQVYPFTIESVREAYTELNAGHVRGKLVVSLSR